MNAKEQSVTYQEARQQGFIAAYTVRIFGVPLDGNVNESHIAIWWCGIAVDGLEHRQGTNRIWHLPNADIVASGEVDGFEFNGHQVYFYDLDRDSDPIEETFSPVSLSHTLRLYFGSLLGHYPLEAQAAPGGPPVTISPNPTTSPTGTPPITISPNPT